MRKRTLYLYYILIFFSTSCQQTSKQATSKLISNTTKELTLIETNGDTIPTGIPFLFEGKQVNVDTLLPLPTILPSIQKVPVQIEKRYPVQKIKTIAFPDDLSKITIGQNGVPLPRKVLAIPEIITAKTPQVTLALNFQKKDRITGAFQYLDVAQGIPGSYVHQIIEDREGYFWMSNGKGITKYDGKTFRNYGKKEGLLHISVASILEDKSGNVWWTYGGWGGLTKFDGTSFFHYSIPQGLNVNMTRNLFEDSEGNIWITSDDGLIKFDGQYFIYYTKAQGLFSNEVFNIKEDKSGFFWIWNENTLTKFDGISFSNFTIKNKTQINWDQFNFTEINDKIWFSLGEQLCLLTQDSITYYTADLWKKKPINFLTVDQSGIVWGGLFQDGIFKFDGTHFTQYNTEDGLTDNTVSPTYADNFGNIWILSHYGFGIHRFKPKTFSHFTMKGLFDSGLISAITEDEKGNIWFGSHGFGLAKYDGASFTKLLIPVPNNFFVIRAICEDNNGNIWLAAPENGLYKYNGKTFIDYTRKGQLALDMVYTITEDNAGNIWFGSAFNGLTKYDGQTYTQYVHDESEMFENSNTIRTLIADKKGNVWAGTYGGLRRFDGEKFTYFTTKEGLSSNRIVSLLEDKKGNIWIGTDDAGVNVFDGQTFRHFSTEEGLSSKIIWTITEDDKGRIWLGANECLNLLHFENNDFDALLTVVQYCDLDGLKGGEFFANASILDSKNNMWWGTNKTMVTIPADYLQPILKSPEIRLDEIEIVQSFTDFRQLSDSIQSGKNWWAGRDKDLNLSKISFDSVVPFHNYPTDLKLPYNLNTITFRFSATKYAQTEKTKFRYFMEGLDSDWSKSLAVNEITYRGLRPGRYTIKAQTAGLEDIWSAPIAYSFQVKPPWWFSIWAYLLWSIIIIGLLYWVSKSMLNRRLEKNETQRIKEINSLKTRLYTNITHEFRTPLTVIMGMNEHIKGHLKEKNLIRRNAQNLLQLINQLLDLSKIESGHLKLNKIQGNIISYLQYLTESFYVMAEAKGIHLTFYTEEEQLLMDFDEEKIQHIVYNLLSNAIKFTQKDGKVIFHIVKIELDGKAFLKMNIKDTGIGIASEKLPHIFNRFYQVDGSHTRKGEGTGIGLAFTKELLNMMEGKIEVSSQPQKGTSFTIHLPIQNTAAIQNTPKLMLRKESFDASLVTENGHIQISENSNKPILLLIEDNTDVVTYISSILEKMYTIHIAQNGKTGIEKALELIPDIIISDVMMPEKDGYEVCDVLKKEERSSHIPIILLTAKSTQEDKLKGLQYGADAFLTKPFNKEELLIRLKKLIDLRKKLQAHYAGFENTGKVPSGLEEVFLQKLSTAIEEHLDDADFSIPQLAQSVHLSQMQVYRKLKALTDKTPSQFIRAIRLAKAKELLKSSDLNISEIAYEVGFTDPNYFSRTFQQTFGKSPSDYRK